MSYDKIIDRYYLNGLKMVLLPVVKMGTTAGTRLSAPRSRQGGRSRGSCGSGSGFHLPTGTSEGEGKIC